jgi:hypothetical protein
MGLINLTSNGHGLHNMSPLAHLSIIADPHGQVPLLDVIAVDIRLLCGRTMEGKDRPSTLELPPGDCQVESQQSPQFDTGLDAGVDCDVVATADR